MTTDNEGFHSHTDSVHSSHDNYTSFFQQQKNTSKRRQKEMKGNTNAFQMTQNNLLNCVLFVCVKIRRNTGLVVIDQVLP